LAFSEQLLEWWDRHGRKDLPWQHPRSAYRVWVAEIMLQQTQVKTVIPYFERFIERFPDVCSLAAAPTDDVLACWSGLGYYARARNLHKTAKICVDEYGGQLPRSPAALAGLPGIGESTANAIYSQAYDQPAVILDGNVKRVLARQFAVEGWPGKPKIHRRLWKIAEDLLPASRGADYTQAVMDLGATLCTRSNPDCGRCPVSATCQAFQTSRVTEFPAKRPGLKIRLKSFRMLVLTDGNGRVLLERRPPAGIWGGLWSLPSDDNGLPLKERLGIELDSMTPLPALQHQLTHLQMDIQPLFGHADKHPGRVECNQDQRWFGRDEWPALGLPQPVRRLLETCLERELI
jgi:A/G-specific adenine glycosylase